MRHNEVHELSFAHFYEKLMKSLKMRRLLSRLIKKLYVGQFRPFWQVHCLINFSLENRVSNYHADFYRASHVRGENEPVYTDTAYTRSRVSHD